MLTHRDRRSPGRAKCFSRPSATASRHRRFGQDRFLHAPRQSQHVCGLTQQTLNVGLTNLDRFSQLGVFSSGWFGQDGAATFARNNQALLADPKLNDRIRLFWIATGKDDFVMPSTKASLAMLDQHKVRYTYKETEGGHTWPNWRAYLNEFAPLLFR